MKREENNSPPPRPFLPSTFKDNNNNNINNNNSSSSNQQQRKAPYCIGQIFQAESCSLFLNSFMTHPEFVYGTNTHQILQHSCTPAQLWQKL